MKTKLSLLALLTSALVLSSVGCSTTSVERTDASGVKFKATNRRAIWNSKGVDVSYEVTTNGTISAHAKIDQSGSDAAALSEGIISGLSKAGILVK